jgi:hypothetical protein
MLDPQEDTMATRHLTPDELDQIARRAPLDPRRRAAITTTVVSAATPSQHVVDAFVDVERMRALTAAWAGPGRAPVTEVRRHGH